MKTPEAVYEYLNSAMDAQEPFLVADKDLLTQLSEMDEATTDERLINKLYKRLSTELIHGR